MERAGKLLANALLGQCQLRCKSAQLKCPSFQFGMTLFQLHMTSAEGLLSLLLQRPLSLFIAAGLEGFLGAGAFDRFPDAFGNITDQLDLSLGPDTWCRAMDTEVGDPVLVFYEHYACKCRDLSRPQTS